MGAVFLAYFQKTKEYQVVTEADLVVLPFIYPDRNHF